MRLQQFRLYRRNGTFYAEDVATKKQESLRTKSKQEALVLLAAKNEAARQPALNLQIARSYLAASDPLIFDDILEYVPEEHREAYWRMVAHFRQLKPDDEILNIIFAMGVLTFVLRELPAGIIEERNAWQTQFRAFREKADEIMEASNRHMVAAANQCEIVSRTLEQSGAQFCESAGRIEVASREAVERIDVDGMAQRLTARVEKRVITRFDDLATTMERRYQLMEKIGEQTKTVIHDLREIHMGRTITVVSALILMACVIGGVSVYSRVRAADYQARR